MSAPRFMLNFTFFGRSMEFLYGMGLALWIARHPVQPIRFGYTGLGLLGIVLFMGGIVVFQYFYHVKGSGDWSYIQIFASSFVLPIFICSLLYGLISEQTILRRLLETKVFDLLGKSSYVLYLIHLGSIDELFRAYVSSNDLVRVVAYVLASIALYKLVEHPLQAGLRAKPKERTRQKARAEMQTT